MKCTYWMFIGFLFWWGVVECSAQSVYNFEGSLDLLNDSARLELDLGEKGQVVFSTKKVSEYNYVLNVELNNLQTARFDWSSQIEGSFEFNSSDEDLQNILSGKIRSQYSLINYEPPTKELLAQFYIDSERRIHFSSFSYARLNASGYVDSFSPFVFDFDVGLKEVDMDDFLSFWMKDKTFEAQGPVSGTVKIKGDKNQVLLNGDLKSFDGYVSRFDFNRIALKMAGVYPYLNVENSSFSSKEGASFSLEGPFNLADKENFKAQIKALTFSPLVSGSELKREWTVKKLETEGRSSKFGYFLEKSIEGSTRSSQTDMLGVEQTLEF